MATSRHDSAVNESSETESSKPSTRRERSARTRTGTRRSIKTTRVKPEPLVLPVNAPRHVPAATIRETPLGRRAKKLAREKVEPELMPLRFAATCQACSEDLPEGALALVTPGRGVRCEECGFARPVAKPRRPKTAKGKRAKKAARRRRPRINPDTAKHLERRLLPCERCGHPTQLRASNGAVFCSAEHEHDQATAAHARQAQQTSEHARAKISEGHWRRRHSGGSISERARFTPS